MKNLKKNLPIALLITVAGGTLPFAALADDMPMRGPMMFEDFDANNDGMISKEEFNNARMNRRAERADNGMPMRGQGMDDRPCQGQGMGMGQGMYRNMPMFSDYDMNGDGMIEHHEYREAHTKRVQERAKAGYQMKNLGTSSGFQGMDTDGDGKVSPEEFRKHQEEMHNR